MIRPVSRVAGFSKRSPAWVMLVMDRRSHRRTVRTSGDPPEYAPPMSGDGLHGRDAELAAIDGALDAVARGERRLLTVRGEAGIGKSRLLAELRERAAAQRFVVLEGRATELERDVPFVPIADALGPDAGDALEATGSGAERWRLHRHLGELLARTAAGRPLLL